MMDILGALKPLPIRTHICTNISMDFIMGLPEADSKSVITVVVNYLSKYAYFCSLAHPSLLPYFSIYSWIISLW